MRIWKTFVAFILLLVTAATVAAAPAQTEPGAITVYGHAEMMVVPDVALVTAGVLTSGSDAAAVKRENDRVMNQIMERLKAEGITADKIQTAAVSLYPLQRSDDRAGVTGYRMHSSVTVTVEDLTRVGAVVDALFQAGANQLQGVSFALRDDRALRADLLRQAVEDGRQQAATIAESLGVRLGRPLSVTQNGRVYPVATDGYRIMKEAAGLPVNPGMLKASVDLTLVFAVQ